jgi:uncharacterized protein
VVLLAMTMPARDSVGAILPLLLVADVFAVAYWHRKAEWPILKRILLPAALGIVAGRFLLGRMDNAALAHTIGGVVLGLVVLQTLRDFGYLADDRVPHHWAFAWSLGGLAGIVTMVANAAGPIIIIFVLAMNLDRFRFIGTLAMYFLILNAFKVPFSVDLNLISMPSLWFNLKLAPLVLAGCAVGLVAPKYIPEKPFRWTIVILAAAAGLKLLILG